MDRKLKTPGLLLRTLLASAATLVALAQGASPGSEPPKLRGQTLDGKSIVLPDDAAGRVILLVLGASKKGGEQTGPWKDHFVADFGPNPHATYYVAALLQRVPAPFRAVIRAGMRGGTPDAARSHVLTSASDEDAWKGYLGMRNDSLPGILLLDESGRTLWSHIGVFDPREYAQLKAAAGTALEHR
ncbi:MAG: hypothetical protein JO138_00405 [Acidobacteriaceae bacterium]|nr:hypothetical protein [Acidobacteriaceae bacterium]